LAQTYNRSTAEVVLSWAIQHKMSVIPRSSQKKHIQQLARLLPNQTIGNGNNPPNGFLSPNDLAKMDLLENSL
jgi:hypothetical protein